VLVIVLVLVIDSRDVSKSTRGCLRSRLFSHSDPLFTQQRSKLDNEHDDENENDSGSEAGKEMQARIVAMLTRRIARFDRDEPPIRKD
jgi:hypothetical protein